jgi:GPH family glycoside/pentoside/hexuronide:cation symporter
MSDSSKTVGTSQNPSSLAADERVPFKSMFLYGCGAFVNNLLAGSIGAMLIVLNLGLGMDPALAGLVGAIPRLFDAITDPLMGYISDNSKTRWGRRRPFIFIGAICVAIVFIALWQVPTGKTEMFYFWYFLVGSILFYLAYTVFATPWVALGYEMTPNYNERTRLMGVQNFIGQLAYFVPPWLLLIMQNDLYFTDMVDGASGVAVIIGLFVGCVGILPAIFLRERMSNVAAKDGDLADISKGAMAHLKDFLSGFGKALAFPPFQKLCIATFLVFNGFILISSFQTYVIIYYVFAGDQAEGAKYAGYAGTVGTLSTFAIIALVTNLGTRIGKRKAFAVSTGISMVGYALKWVCYDPANPWLVMLPMPLMAFGLGGLFTLMPAMVADVVDSDELETGERREGMFGAIFWWVVKLGMAAAIAGGGFLLQMTGFDVQLGGAQSEQTIFLLRVFDAFIPVVASAIAIWAVVVFEITRERAHLNRVMLELCRKFGINPADKFSLEKFKQKIMALPQDPDFAAWHAAQNRLGGA